MRNRLTRLFFGRTFGLFVSGVLFVSDMVFRANFLRFPDRFFCNGAGPWSIAAPPDLLLAVSLVAVVALLVVFLRTESRTIRWSAVLILAGGAGNLFDRLVLGCVRDFRVVPRFPAFNFGDILLTVGALILILAISRNEKRLS